jgi:hypothetical protein
VLPSGGDNVVTGIAVSAFSCTTAPAVKTKGKHSSDDHKLIMLHHIHLFNMFHIFVEGFIYHIELHTIQLPLKKTNIYIIREIIIIDLLDRFINIIENHT